MTWTILMGISFVSSALAGAAPSVPDPYTAPPLPATADPLSWERFAAAPEPRRTMNDDEYRKRMRAVFAAAPTSQPASAEPGSLVVLRVDAVEPKSQAARAGIRKGDALISLDDAPLWASDQLISLRTRNAQSLTVATPAGQRRRVRIVRGDIGLTASPLWDARRAYLQDPQRSSRFDADVLIAAAVVRSDPLLAETALRNAFDKGFRGIVLDRLLALIADREWRYEDVLGLTVASLDLGSEPERVTFAKMAYLASLRTFKLELARTLLKQYPDADADPNAMDRLDDSISAFRRIPAEKTANPIEQIQGMRFRDANHEITCSHSDEDRLCHDWSEATARQLATEGSFVFNIPPSHYAVAACGPAGADADLQVRFHFSATDGVREPEADSKLALVIADRAATDNGVGSFPHVARVTFHNSGVVELVRTGAPDATASIGPAFGAARSISARICVIGHRMEVVVDGHRLLYGPVLSEPSVRQLCPMLRFDGSKGAVEEFTWRLPEVIPGGG